MKHVVLALSRGVLALNKIDESTIKNCDSAIMTYKKNNCEFICTVGGIFQPKDIQDIPISELMKKYILKEYNDIKIISENMSLDTWQNIQFLVELFNKNNISKEYKVFICADHLHALRVKILLKHYGFISEIVKSKIKLDLKTIIKEIILICMTIVDKTGEKNIIVKNILNKERNKRKDGNVYLNYNTK